MRPFFSFFGSKYRVAPHYPKPIHPTIIEPFAGSCGYALRYHDRMVKLYDLDPTICALWAYLIKVTPEEIRSLPLEFDHVDELHVCAEAKHLIGFWCNKGSVQPAKSPSKWMRENKSWQPGVYWAERIRERIASQVDSIRHWKIEQASYADIPDRGCATWFIDPPYEKAGKAYKFHDIDYAHLGKWCRSRTGQVIVCENAGAIWLPFSSFKTIKAMEGRRGGKKSVEVVWTNDERPALPPTTLPSRLWQPSCAMA
jgi:site-specific DNA-adenine methylase